MYTLELNGSRVHEVVIDMTNGSGNGKLRGIGTDGKGARNGKEENREESGWRKRRFLVFCFVFNLPKKIYAPFFFSTTPHKENPF